MNRSPEGRVTGGALSSGWGRGPQAAGFFVCKDLCGHWVTDSSLSPAGLSSLHRLSFCLFPSGILKLLLLTQSKSPLPPVTEAERSRIPETLSPSRLHHQDRGVPARWRRQHPCRLWDEVSLMEHSQGHYPLDAGFLSFSLF